MGFKDGGIASSAAYTARATARNVVANSMFVFLSGITSSIVIKHTLGRALMRLLTEFAEYIFRKITYTNDDITPEILDWKLVEEANSIHWILTHQARIANILIPQVITGTNNPAGWDDNYQEQLHNLEDLRNDLKEARENVLSMIDRLSEEDLNREIRVWQSKQSLKEAIFALLGELLHHNGQIAMLKGIKRRISQRD